MSKIEAVIFDAGGVLHENNYAVTEDLASELGLSKEVLAQIWKEKIPLLGSGKIDEAEFWQQVSEKYGLRQVRVDENLLGRAFAKQLIPFAEVRAIIQGLGRLSIKTAVLSDTIEPHAKVLREAGLYDDFDIVLLSYEIGLRKPHIDIYEYTLNTLGVKASRTVFIDDDPENAQAATYIGIHGITFTNPDQLRESLKELIPEL